MWKSLKIPPHELRLDSTLRCGQTFRWSPLGHLLLSNGVRPSDDSGRNSGTGEARSDRRSIAQERDAVRALIASAELRDLEQIYVGVIGERVVALRQTADDVLYQELRRTGSSGSGVYSREQVDSSLSNCLEQNETAKRRLSSSNDCRDGAGGAGDDNTDQHVGIPAMLRHYFALDCVSLENIYAEFSKRDALFRRVSPAFPGIRIIRQPPTECLFSFICSQNNNIFRIESMIHKLCELCGNHLGRYSIVLDKSLVGNLMDAVNESFPNSSLPLTARVLSDAESSLDIPFDFYAFPSVLNISSRSEETFRNGGFGYRAKYIVGAAQKILEQEKQLDPNFEYACSGEGAKNVLKNENPYLLYLRSLDRLKLLDALVSFPGVGMKVASCCALFCFDSWGTIPIDTHIWDIGVREFVPAFRKQPLSDKRMAVISDAFRERFGDRYAGWAQQVLFASELSSFKDRTNSTITATDTGSTSDSQSTKKRKR